MKKLLMVGLLFILSITFFGCSSISGNEGNIADGENALSMNDATVKTVQYHNSSRVKSFFDFPTTIKEGDTVTKEITVGGKYPGLTLKVDLTVKVNKEDDKYIVLLKEDYNIKINGKKAISFWKYVVSKDNVVLLDKSEDGYLVNTIK